MTTRVSLLITTCENESLLDKQRRAGFDVAVLEMEDGVRPENKADARKRCLNALQNWDYGSTERWVRTNELTSVEGFRDVLELTEGRPDAFVLAKLQEADEVRIADYLLSRREEELGLPIGGIRIVPMVETAAAVINLREICTASSRVLGVLVGTEDLSVSAGYVRTPDDYELAYARSLIVTTTHALGVECWDVASMTLDDVDVMDVEAKRSYHLGFDGKIAISPSQLGSIQRAFMPSEEEIDKARRVLAAERAAKAEGRAVYAVDRKMTDGPFVKMAERVLRRAGLDTE